MNKIKRNLLFFSLFLASFALTTQSFADWIIRSPGVPGNNYTINRFNQYNWAPGGVGMYPGFYYVPQARHYYSPGVYWGPGYYSGSNNTRFVVPQPYYYYYQY